MRGRCLLRLLLLSSFCITSWRFPSKEQFIELVLNSVIIMVKDQSIKMDQLLQQDVLLFTQHNRLLFEIAANCLLLKNFSSILGEWWGRLRIIFLLWQLWFTWLVEFDGSLTLDLAWDLLEHADGSDLSDGVTIGLQVLDRIREICFQHFCELQRLDYLVVFGALDTPDWCFRLLFWCFTTHGASASGACGTSAGLLVLFIMVSHLHVLFKRHQAEISRIHWFTVDRGDELNAFIAKEFT